jgi:hypothetical protein
VTHPIRTLFSASLVVTLSLILPACGAKSGDDDLGPVAWQRFHVDATRPGSVRLVYISSPEVPVTAASVKSRGRRTVAVTLYAKEGRDPVSAVAKLGCVTVADPAFRQPGVTIVDGSRQVTPSSDRLSPSREAYESRFARRFQINRARCPEVPET